MGGYCLFIRVLSVFYPVSVEGCEDLGPKFRPQHRAIVRVPNGHSLECPSAAAIEPRSLLDEGNKDNQRNCVQNVTLWPQK